MGGKGSGRTGSTEILCVRLSHSRMAQIEAYMLTEGFDTKTAAVDSLLAFGISAANRNAKKIKKKACIPGLSVLQ